jgi:hypothetical protein
LKGSHAGEAAKSEEIEEYLRYMQHDSRFRYDHLRENGSATVQRAFERYLGRLLATHVIVSDHSMTAADSAAQAS